MLELAFEPECCANGELTAPVDQQDRRGVGLEHLDDPRQKRLQQLVQADAVERDLGDARQLPQCRGRGLRLGTSLPFTLEQLHALILRALAAQELAQLTADRMECLLDLEISRSTYLREDLQHPGNLSLDQDREGDA